MAGDKNEILFSQFGINYNKENDQLKKGTTIIKVKETIQMENEESKTRTKVVELSCDIIGDKFWADYPHLLEPYRDL